MFVPAQRNPPIPLGSSLRSQQNAPLPIASNRPLHTSAAAVSYNEIGVPLPPKAVMPSALHKFVDQRTSANLLQTNGRSATALLRVGQTTINPTAPFQIDRFELDTRYIPTTAQEPKKAPKVSDALVSMLSPNELAQSVENVIDNTSQHIEHGRYHKLEEAHFRNFMVQPPHVAEVPLSVSKELIERAHKDVFCLTPSERRQLARFEKEQQILLHERKREVRQRMALVDAMRKAYPNGIENFDTPALPDSLVYADTSAKLHAKQEALIRHAEGRSHQIGDKFYSDEHFAPPPLDPSEPPAHFIQSKIRAFGCPDAIADTHQRLFNRSQSLPRIDPHRAQTLRNHSTNGKSYDIITGAEIQVMPPTIPERKERFKGHDSLTMHSKFR